MITINIALPTYLQRVLHCGAHRLLYQHMFRLIHRRGRPSQSHTKHLNTGGGGEEAEGGVCLDSCVEC